MAKWPSQKYPGFRMTISIRQTRSETPLKEICNQIAARMSTPLPGRLIGQSGGLAGILSHPPHGISQTSRLQSCHSLQVSLQYVTDKRLVPQHFLSHSIQGSPLRGCRHDGLLGSEVGENHVKCSSLTSQSSLQPLNVGDYFLWLTLRGSSVCLTGL